MADSQKPLDDSNFSPTSGCIIMILAVVVLGGISVFFVVQGFRMDREIDTFTTALPIEYPVANPSLAESATLKNRLQEFAEAALENRDTELALTAADLNNLIATEPFLRDFQKNTHIVEISDEFIVAEMSQMLNSLKPGKPRYLNARFHLRPRRIDGEFDLALVDITGTDNPIPQGFIDLYAQRRFFKPDKENKTLGPLLEKLSEIEIRGHKLVVTAAASQAP